MYLERTIASYIVPRLGNAFDRFKDDDDNDDDDDDDDKE